ncbi:DAHL domain-containing protein [Sinimarinibacterium sp. CAU 1509]|uniref:DAHL domain-containing protein n=1 Tax=Sinimarinibacterium sp. CAU 1509 TaxID=2562283 RepID=UPI00146A5BB1|nr:DAHL domain-containing protein [Sinimarinibacterium sp. CAU 1509]
MTWRKLLPPLALLLAAGAIGLLAFLAQRTQAVDNTLHLQRLHQIRVVDALDVGLNRAVTQVGVSTMVNVTNDRATTTAQLGDALNALEQGPTSLRGLSPALDQALDTFLDTVESKFELAFDFEARNILVNQRLIAGIDAVPVMADAVLAAADTATHDMVAGLLRQLRTEVNTFGVVQTPVNEDRIHALLTQLDALAPGQSEAFVGALRSLRARSADVIADKQELVGRLGNFLARPTAPQLHAVEQAYMDWHGTQVAVANQYRSWLAAYAAILLLVLAWLGLRLRRSYRDLDRANAELSHANEHLEEQVDARTHDLQAALKELQASQAQLIQSEKMASLGQMVAGVAHEINTPLGYARSNAEIVRTSLADIRSLVDAQSRALNLLTQDDASDDDIAQSVAAAQGIAESIGASELVDELDTLLGDTDHGLAQISDLVGSLKDFSRVDRSRTDLFDVNDGLEAALKICHNQLKHRIEVVKSYAQLPAIECSPSQLNQVFLNLFNNAAQAIEGEGKLYIHTAPGPRGVAIRILDTGSGMAEDVRARIFEPFFTTKPVGKGTGLGLSIVFRIIEDHGGHIDVRSTPGKGSEFAIHLPLKQARPETPPATEALAA